MNIDTNSIDRMINSLEEFKKSSDQELGSNSVYGITKELESIQDSIDNITNTLECHKYEKMKKLHPCEVNTDSTLNTTIRSGHLGVIELDDGTFELVYFTHCHYEGSNGRISNTFEYRSFDEHGVLQPQVKNHYYKNIYDLSSDAKKKFSISIILNGG